MPTAITTFDLPSGAHRILSDVARVVGPEGWREALPHADALVCLLSDRIDRRLLDQAPELRIVANAVVGYDHVDMEACRERGITVTNTPDVLTEATADLAWALILATVRRLAQAERDLRAGNFHGWGFHDYLGGDLQGRTLGILGMGRIGQATARRASPFGMRVIYHSRTRVPDAERELGARYVEMDALLGESDVVSLHAPLTEDTRHLIDAGALRRMRPTAYVVNTARGALVHELALVEALREGRIAGAGLDVYENEPDVHPGLLALENVVLLPHIGSATREVRTRMATLAAENARAMLRGEPPLTPVT